MDCHHSFNNQLGLLSSMLILAYTNRTILRCHTTENRTCLPWPRTLPCTRQHTLNTRQ